MEKLLYAEDAPQIGYAQLEDLLSLKSIGIDEVVFLQRDRDGNRRESLENLGIVSTTEMVDGPFVASVLEKALSHQVSLIVVHQRGNSKNKEQRSRIKTLLGSSPVPVIVIPENGEKDEMKTRDVLNRIVYATDWSPNMETAFEFVKKYCNVVKEVEIVHVIDRTLSVRDLRKLQHDLKELRRQFIDQGMDAESHIYAGKRCEEIVLAARDYNVSCIVMGKVNRSKWHKMLGSHCSVCVAYGSPVPTLVIPHQNGEGSV